MATRSFRSAGTTINVTVPSRTRSTRGRSRTTTRARTTPRTQTRTIRQVYTPSRRSNTPLLVGAALAAGALFLLLSPGTPPAEASPTPPPLPPVPGPTPGPGTTPMNPAFPQVAGAPLGYAGPGSYRVIAPSGLNLRPQPNTSQPASQTLPPGTVVEVVASTPNGWVQVAPPTAGYLCLSCVDAPGGPWLVRQA